MTTLPGSLLRGAGTVRVRLLRLLLPTVFCALAFLPGASVLPPVDRDEARFAQASRQMLETGDYVDIRFQDEPRYKKPVGIHWLQAASARLFGAEDEIWAYRMPSFLGATLAVLLTALLGGVLFDAPTGIAAAIMLGSSILLGVEARLATTDAVLLATVVATLGALARLLVPLGQAPPPRWAAPCFWASLGLGILVKGPIILVFVLPTVLCLRFWMGDRKISWLQRFRPAIGVPLLIAIVAPWGIAIALASHGIFFERSLGHDFLAKVLGGQESHGFPPGFHLAAFWFGFWPFAPLAALVAPWLWAQRREPAIAFCLAWLLPGWLIFELVPTKLPHYVLPVYPAVALLAARALLQSAATPGRVPRWSIWPALLGPLGGLVLGAAILAMPWYLEGRPPVAAVIAAIASIGISLAVFGLLRADRRIPALLAGGAGAVACYALVFQFALPKVDALWLSRRAADKIESMRPCPDSVLASAGYEEPSLVFLAGTATRLVDGAAAGRHLLEQHGCGLALVEESQQAAFSAVFANTAATPERLARLKGFNYSKGRPLRLTLYSLRRSEAAGP